VNNEDLYTILDEARVVKSPEEIRIMKYTCMLASEAHEKVLRGIRPGNTEFQCEALFKFHNLCVAGARFDPYNCICGSEKGSATLHYELNDKVIKDDVFVLCDMGAKYYGYCSDITVTFPSNGTFNPKQKIIYNAVLAA
jgi:Xaa-Pro aminopeptidase